MRWWSVNLASYRDGEVTFEKEISYNYSYFQMRNLGTLIIQLYRDRRQDVAQEMEGK